MYVSVLFLNKPIPASHFDGKAWVDICSKESVFHSIILLLYVNNRIGNSIPEDKEWGRESDAGKDKKQYKLKVKHDAQDLEMGCEKTKHFYSATQDEPAQAVQRSGNF